MTRATKVTTRRVRSTLTTAVAVLAAGAAVAGAQLASSDPADPGQGPNAELTAIQPAQSADFAVLRDDAASAATLTTAASALLDRQLTDSTGASPDLARFARTGVDGDARYVVPGRGWICLVSGAGRGWCNQTAAIVAGYGLGAYRVEGATVLDGVVPDGVSAVEVTGPDGASAQVSVQANVWTASVAFTPTMVHWTGADTVAHDVPVGAVPPPGGPPPGG